MGFLDFLFGKKDEGPSFGQLLPADQIPSDGKYPNMFKVEESFVQKKGDGKRCVALGDVVSGSFSVGDTVVMTFQSKALQVSLVEIMACDAGSFGLPMDAGKQSVNEGDSAWLILDAPEPSDPGTPIGKL